MNAHRIAWFWRLVRRGQVGLSLGLGLVVALLSACASGPSKPQPGPLPAQTAVLPVSKAWALRLGGEVSTHVQAAVNGSQIVLVSSQGALMEIDVHSAQVLWRHQIKEPIAAGVGSDGRRHAVITTESDLVVVQDGRELWRQKLSAHTLTAPLVAGERVFVLMADRTVQAFDGASGQRLWSLPRNPEGLVVNQAGVLMAVGNTLLAANGGRLSAIEPNSGQTAWEVVVGRSRGTNEVERLVDLVGSVSRLGSNVCLRSYQTSVACVDTARAQVLWTRAAHGFQGLDGDELRVYGVESDSKLRAWSRRDGQVLWSEDSYRFRGLTAPRVWGPTVVFGDEQGVLHWLSRDEGKTLQRMSTDGTPLVMQPMLVDSVLVTVNRSGLVTGWRVAREPQSGG